jgi:hypothetical protein
VTSKLRFGNFGGTILLKMVLASDQAASADCLSAVGWPMLDPAKANAIVAISTRQMICLPQYRRLKPFAKASDICRNAR